MECPECGYENLAVVFITEGWEEWRLESIKDGIAQLSYRQGETTTMSNATLSCNHCGYETTNLPFNDWEGV